MGQWTTGAQVGFYFWFAWFLFLFLLLCFSRFCFWFLLNDKKGNQKNEALEKISVPYRCPIGRSTRRSKYMVRSAKIVRPRDDGVLFEKCQGSYFTLLKSGKAFFILYRKIIFFKVLPAARLRYQKISSKLPFRQFCQKMRGLLVDFQFLYRKKRVFNEKKSKRILELGRQLAGIL